MIASAAAWISAPSLAIWFTLIALFPWVFRLLGGRSPFQRTPLDLLLAIFLITAWVGYWAAYDKDSAWVKFWLIVSAVLLYYALSGQPRRNLGLLSFLCLCLALSIAVYFLLTYDFIGTRIGAASWWMTHRPRVDWPALDHGNSSGLLLMSSIFAMYWFWGLRKKTVGAVSVVLGLLLVFIIGLISVTFLLTVSHGVWLAVLGAIGFFLLWKVSSSPTPTARRIGFPILVMVLLAVLVAFVYMSPARLPAGVTSNAYGINSRAETLVRGAYFLRDYPVTGAGLTSFPGLYSQYMLVIPHFFFGNSYNLFLDISIEQGLVGGVAFLLICLAAIWLVSRRIVTARSSDSRLVNWLSLLALVVMMVYGLFYDNLYYGSGTALLLFPLGISMIGVRRQHHHSGDGGTRLSREMNMAMVSLPVLALVLMVGVNTNNVTAQWYANLGAVQMSQAELKNFPTGQWATPDILPELAAAESTLRTAMQYDPMNQPANYRLGLISMLRRDYETAVGHLEIAHQAAPNHRGIIKNLGYAYVWLGELDKAQALLHDVPEAQNEMSVYTWWWGTQGRSDLAENASRMASRLISSHQ